MKIFNRFKLLFKTSKDYLYWLLYPEKGILEIKKYNPAVKKAGENLIEKIHELYPELKIHFIGSVPLKIIGQWDIDLYIESNPKKFNYYQLGLTEILGKKAKQRKDFIEWNSMYQGFNLEVVLINPHCDRQKDQLFLFETLKNNLEIRSQYIKLKQSLNGKSLQEYNKKKIEFFYSIRKNLYQC